MILSFNLGYSRIDPIVKSNPFRHCAVVTERLTAFFDRDVSATGSIALRVSDFQTTLQPVLA
jgi:hypothetical protein